MKNKNLPPLAGIFIGVVIGTALWVIIYAAACVDRSHPTYRSSTQEVAQ